MPTLTVPWPSGEAPVCKSGHCSSILQGTSTKKMFEKRTSFFIENNMDNYENQIESIIDNGYNFSIRQYVKDGFKLFKSCSDVIVPFSFVVLIAEIHCAFAPGIFFIIAIYIYPCMIASFYLTANLVTQGVEPSLNDCLYSFKIFINIMIINIVVNLSTAAGLLLFIIPGIFLMTSYVFASMFVIFFDTNYLTALKLSRKLVSRKFWKMLALVMISIMIGCSGILFWGIGIAFTLPIMHCILYTAFENIVRKQIIEVDNDYQK